jgi:hypothetical protein
LWTGAKLFALSAMRISVRLRSSSPAKSARARVSSSASRRTRSGAWRIISSAT